MPASTSRTVQHCLQKSEAEPRDSHAEIVWRSEMGIDWMGGARELRVSMAPGCSCGRGRGGRRQKSSAALLEKNDKIERLRRDFLPKSPVEAVSRARDHAMSLVVVEQHACQRPCVAAHRCFRCTKQLDRPNQMSARSLSRTSRYPPSLPLTRAYPALTPRLPRPGWRPQM